MNLKFNMKIMTFCSLFVAMLLVSVGTAQAGPGHHSGTVLEAKNAGGYTYLNIDEDGKTFWIAGPVNDFKKGDKVNFDEQIWMTNFESKALGITFEKLLFVGSVNSGDKAPVANVTPPGSEKKVKKAKNPCFKKSKGNVYTVEEIYENKVDLEGKTITVVGEVVKVSPMIMGQNWIHVQDGTGKEGSTNNLVFRAPRNMAVVGQKVTAKGKLEIDVDFGMGYFYGAIVEGSSFTVK